MASRKNIKNPKNPRSNLYKTLTRLFSGPIIDYRSQTIRKYRRHQLDKFAKTFKSLSGQQFKKSSYNPFHNIQSNVISAQNRVERYADFDQMEYTPEIASALDIYADEMTTSSHLQPLLTIETSNEEIKTVLHSLYHNVMNIEFNLFGWCRTMCKYGDMFLYVDLDEEHGVKNVIALPYNEIERIEGEDKTNPNYVQFQWNQGGLTFENWQIAHFRILGNDKFAPYGTSALEAARRIWRQLTLLEDAMMAYRIVRSPERRVFYIDTGNVPASDVEQYMQKVMTQMKRNQVVDQDTGRVDLRYNPLSVEEDYFIPIRGGISSRVESLAGGTYTGDIDDVKYLRDKLFSALKIPQSYLSRGEGAEEDKTTLAQKDIRFARTIQRLQRVIVSELEKLGIVHLYSLGYRAGDLVSFKLKLNNPSKIAELQELEHWKTKFDIAASATEGYFSRRWIADNIFDLSDEEFLRNQREIFSDRKYLSALDQAAEPEEDMMGGVGPGQMGAVEDLPPEPAPETDDLLPPPGDLPPEGGDLPPAGDEAPPEDDSALLAAPAKRDDDRSIKMVRRGDDGRTQTTTDGANGKWHTPVAYDGRETAGPRTKNYRRIHTPEFSTTRKLYPGYSDLTGLKDLGLLGKGLMEGEESNYKDEEDLLLEINNEVKSLITELEKKTMKLRHNKKRNTAFLYETLVKELTKSVVNNDTNRKKAALSILREHFKKGSILGNELSLYKDVVESRGLDYETASKILHEAKMVYWSGFKNKKVYDEQSKVIDKVNKDLSKNTFSNFVPNYKDLATLAQIFNDDLTVKKRVMLEKQILKNMISENQEPEKKMKPIDKLTFKTFIKKFNSTYGELQENQKELLMQYIYSFSDDGVGLKVYLNEEVKTLKKVVEESMELEEIKSDPSMLESTKKVIGIINEYKNKNIDETMIGQVLNIQRLVKEIQSDG